MAGGPDPWQALLAALVPVLVLYRQELLERRADRQRQVILDAATAAEGEPSAKVHGTNNTR